MRVMSNIVRQEQAAWQAYVAYMQSKQPIGPKTGTREDREVYGDDESRRLFTVWRTLRNERDGISNPRHKRDNIQFQPRSST